MFRTKCAICKQLVSLTVAGVCNSHGPKRDPLGNSGQLNRCPGSGHPPMMFVVLENLGIDPRNYY